MSCDTSGSSAPRATDESDGAADVALAAVAPLGALGAGVGRASGDVVTGAVRMPMRPALAARPPASRPGEGNASASVVRAHAIDSAIG